jgi:hypothetical protein
VRSGPGPRPVRVATARRTQPLRPRSVRDHEGLPVLEHGEAFMIIRTAVGAWRLVLALRRVSPVSRGWPVPGSSGGRADRWRDLEGWVRRRRGGR